MCDSGFLLVDGDDFRVCGFDGLWSGDEPTCEGMPAMDCYMPNIQYTGKVLQSGGRLKNQYIQSTSDIASYRERAACISTAIAMQLYIVKNRML